MNARFQSEVDAKIAGERVLVDPEAYDASEQAFAASLEETRQAGLTQSAQATGADAAVEVKSEAAGEIASGAVPGRMEDAREPIPQVNLAEASATESSLASARNASGVAESIVFAPPAHSSNPGAWREEVAARLNNYRSRRRPREPRYPSLQLKFEPTDPVWNSSATAQAMALDAAPRNSPRRPPSRPTAAAETAGAERIATTSPAESGAESTARIIPFPRSSVAPPRPLEELAEPVPDQPRILEVPDVAPPAPALGGILIEPEEPAKERRPGFEIPLQSARLSPRLLAALIDGVVVCAAMALAGWIVFKMSASVPPLRDVAATAVVGLGIIWFGYQYLLLVYAGTTPGLKLARLQLSRFEGQAAPRRIRRWRVLASALSAVSLGLGYAWCILDEDQLCWHDRITRTYLSPLPASSSSKPADC